MPKLSKQMHADIEHNMTADYIVGATLENSTEYAVWCLFKRGLKGELEQDEGLLHEQWAVAESKVYDEAYQSAYDEAHDL